MNEENKMETRNTLVQQKNSRKRCYEAVEKEWPAWGKAHPIHERLSIVK